MIHPSLLALIFLSTSSKIDLKFSGTSAPSAPFRSIEVLRQQVRKGGISVFLKLISLLLILVDVLSWRFLIREELKKMVFFIQEIFLKIQFFSWLLPYLKDSLTRYCWFITLENKFPLFMKIKPLSSMFLFYKKEGLKSVKSMLAILLSLKIFFLNHSESLPDT